MKRLACIAVLGLTLLMVGCGEENKIEPLTPLPIESSSQVMSSENEADLMEETVESSPEEQEEVIEYVYINPDGENMQSRIYTPEGYERTGETDESFAAYLRNYPLKPYGSPVLLYDGSEKYNQQDHISVFALPIENYDLQQCADSVIRMYAEYYYSTGQYEKIAFHYTNGFLAEYSKWRNGQRISVEGNNVSWVSSAGYDDSYDCFVKYLKNVFTYAGTLSMNGESKAITLEEAKAGDVFLYGGSPGHVVMIVDVCENAEGEKAYLLAQGYMPAQEFHILINEAHPENPWYYESEITYPFVTPEYVFTEGSLKRLMY